jgi:L-threonylcarbamoyladenylate synthase
MKNFNLEIKHAVAALKSGQLIIFPTDTYWSLGCDANNEAALNKLYTLKQSNSERNITCFVADDRMLSKYVQHIPFAAKSIIEVADTPTTIIYDAPKNIAQNLIPKDNTIAIRIPDDEFCYQLTRRFNGAIATSIAHIEGETIPKSFKEIAPTILKDVDYIVNLQKEKISKNAASIIQITNSNVVRVLRK